MKKSLALAKQATCTMWVFSSLIFLKNSATGDDGKKGIKDRKLIRLWYKKLKIFKEHGRKNRVKWFIFFFKQLNIQCGKLEDFF
jgi:hypothetical protein